MSQPLTLGVLGGMGPAATLDLLAKIQMATPARGDADHIRVLVDINPQVPDLSGPAGRSAGPVLAQMALGLKAAGAQVLAIACNSAHAHLDFIRMGCGLPVIDMIETAAHMARATGANRVGVLGGARSLKLYREHLAARGLGEVFLPPDRQEAFMALVARIKAGEMGKAAQDQAYGFCEELKRLGAQAIIAGCTELPLVLDWDQNSTPVIDGAQVLALRCVAVCKGLEPVPA